MRKEEQASFEAAAHRTRCVCVISDWGLGKEGFLGASIERLVKPISSAEIFRLVCDEVETVEEILSAADSQFGTSFQQFCALVAALSPAFLIFDEVPDGFVAGGQQETFARLIRSTLDYCPDLCVIVTTRQKPQAGFFTPVTLQPLDALAVKTYLNTHPQSASPIEDADVVERIENWSGGLPMHLDRLLELLPASSLSAILDEEIDYVPATPQLVEPIPRALQNAVAHLAGSSNEYSRRSFRMLKVLTVLAEGETIQSIKRFYPAEPFHLQNVTELIRLITRYSRTGSNHGRISGPSSRNGDSAPRPSENATDPASGSRLRADVDLGRRALADYPNVDGPSLRTEVAGRQNHTTQRLAAF